MDSNPRLLRALVIHDTSFSKEDPKSILGTSDLDLYSFLSRRGRSIPRLRRWVDVVEVMNVLARTSSLDNPEQSPPDLLLIDSEFGKDPTSPRPLSEAYDPRGLLYGAVIAAHFQGCQGWRAFASALYSQDMSRAASNPWAQTFYSLLSAMQDPLPEVIEPEHFARLMSSHKGGTSPSEAVGAVLSRYRDHLQQSFDDYLDPDFGSFESTLAKFNGSRQEGLAPREDLFLGWRNAQGWVTRIFLRSLFADLRPMKEWAEPWSADEAAPIEQLITSVIERKPHRGSILRPTQKILQQLEVTDSISWGSSDEVYEKKLRRVLAFSLRWAESRCYSICQHTEPEGTCRLYESLGLEAGQINRALGAVLPTQQSRFQARRFITALDNASKWPFDCPAYLPGLVALHLKEAFEAGREECARQYWPRCLAPLA